MSNRHVMTLTSGVLSCMDVIIIIIFFEKKRRYFYSLFCFISKKTTAHPKHYPTTPKQTPNSMASLWRAATALTEKQPRDYDGVEFWFNPERTGWLMKQGE